ncbi:hypothetical protein M407DRAFT_99325 [Tulasnella calospora MUT 4182]|uniref:Uncharacterized protein n=1 Tax=Tulasnella calospora MUT 4182 TaxID=1051891 RepID=A0A0C3Q5V8_9AGAM|nr:hypothetical protein M407DRAFT_99325 [Tulasnella calospora MUT 4182]
MLPSHTGLFKLLLILSYASFLFNASATMSSLILIDKLGEMAFLNRNARHVDQKTVPMSANRLLGTYELEPDWYRVQAHCLISLLLGCGCIFLQIALYTWLKEPGAVFAATAVITCWCIMPAIISIYHNINKAYS